MEKAKGYDMQSAPGDEGEQDRPEVQPLSTLQSCFSSLAKWAVTMGLRALLHKPELYALTHKNSQENKRKLNEASIELKKKHADLKQEKT